MANVIDNFLPDEEFRKLKAIVMGLGMPWYYSPSITTRNLSDDKNFYMSHIFYSKNKFSDMFSFITPLMDAVAPDNVIRIKANLYPNQGDKVVHDSHYDYDFSHKAAVFSINTNDGATIMPDGEHVESIANRIVFFDGSEMHSSTTCTNASVRVNINMNYTKVGL
jgi:hypothetical protein|tara:strand:+ start:400 stop:894 length:495 start_codon:yes stop_codon:yes gene_type:complete